MPLSRAFSFPFSILFQKNELLFVTSHLVLLLLQVQLRLFLRNYTQIEYILSSWDSSTVFHSNIHCTMLNYFCCWSGNTRSTITSFDKVIKSME